MNCFDPLVFSSNFIVQLVLHIYFSIILVYVVIILYVYVGFVR